MHSKRDDGTSRQAALAARAWHPEANLNVVRLSGTADRRKQCNIRILVAGIYRGGFLLETGAYPVPMSAQHVFEKPQTDDLGISIRGLGLRISGYASGRLNRRAVSGAVSRLAGFGLHVPRACQRLEYASGRETLDPGAKNCTCQPASGEAAQLWITLIYFE